MFSPLEVLYRLDDFVENLSDSLRVKIKQAKSKREACKYTFYANLLDVAYSSWCVSMFLLFCVTVLAGILSIVAITLHFFINVHWVAGIIAVLMDIVIIVAINSFMNCNKNWKKNHE